MTLRTTLIALTLALVPAVSFAFGCSERGHQAQSCAPGTTWDDNQQACVEQASS